MRKFNYTLITAMFGLIVVAAMLGTSVAYPTITNSLYSDTTAEDYYPVYRNGAFDAEDLMVNWYFPTQWAILTGLDFAYCGNNTGGVGPYAIDLGIDTQTTSMNYQVRNLSYVTFGNPGSWVHLNFTGPDYLLSNYFTAHFWGVNSSSDCPNILWNYEDPGHVSSSSYNVNDGGWMEAGDGEFLVSLRYQFPLVMDVDVEYSSEINDTNTLDAYYFRANGGENGVPSSIILNRTEGTGDLKVRVFDGADLSLITLYESTVGHLVQEMSTTKYPSTLNLTSTIDRIYLVIVESTTPGVDLANYTLEFEQYPTIAPNFAAQYNVVVENSVMFAWLPIDYADQYEIFRNTSPITDVTGLTPVYTTSQTTWTDTFPAYDTYYYVIRGINSSGAGVISKSVNVTYTQVPVMNLLSANPNPVNVFGLNWSAVPEALSYKVYRSTIPIKTVSGMVPITTLGFTTYVDTVPGYGVYYYAVVAVTGTGDTPVSANVVGVYTAAPVLDIIVANPKDDDYMQLTWNAIPGAMYYKIYRSTAAITSLAGLEPIGTPSGTTYANVLTEEGTYFYVVVGVTSGGDTLPSNSVRTTYTKPAAFPWLWVIIGIAAGGGGAVVALLFVRQRRSGPARQMSAPTRPKPASTVSTAELGSVKGGTPTQRIAGMPVTTTEGIKLPVEKKQKKEKKEKEVKLPRKKLKPYKAPKVKKSNKKVKGFWGNIKP